MSKNPTPAPWSADTHEPVMVRGAVRHRVSGEHSGDKIIGMTETDYLHAAECVNRCAELAKPEFCSGPLLADDEQTVDRVAELLLDNGWHDRGDAQWGRLRDLLPELRAMLAAPTPPVADDNSEREGELSEIADGAWGDGPAVRGAARDKLAAERRRRNP
ncbi:hypothetical protein JN531_003985 [Flagellatimonas centrodinii]|uniref:hypothetical protein n=1 Tax=Flagellatimonas centrodinii TaxID=2806210 RepID=UPI001FEF81F5|nr:hypothetical protein [Flagellatimonas centrodinii]ULQ47447.1 hypothetical protein JN531_003985 [Flagellatimonas centrodinii]